MTRKKKKPLPKPAPAPDDRLIRLPSRNAVLAPLVTPALVYGFVFAIIAAEADSSWEVFLMALIGAAVTGLWAAVKGYGLPFAVLATVWFPAVLAWKRIFWAIGMPSPGGAAVSLLRWGTGREAPAWAALCATLGAVSAGIWLWLRFDARKARRAFSARPGS